MYMNICMDFHVYLKKKMQALLEMWWTKVKILNMRSWNAHIPVSLREVSPTQFRWRLYQGIYEISLAVAGALPLNWKGHDSRQWAICADQNEGRGSCPTSGDKKKRERDEEWQISSESQSWSGPACCHFRGHECSPANSPLDFSSVSNVWFCCGKS